MHAASISAANKLSTIVIVFMVNTSRWDGLVGVVGRHRQPLHCASAIARSAVMRGVAAVGTGEVLAAADNDGKQQRNEDGRSFHHSLANTDEAGAERLGFEPIDRHSN